MTIVAHSVGLKFHIMGQIMEKKSIDIKTERQFLSSYFGNKKEVTFDEYIEVIQKLKQNYLEDSFLLKRKVGILIDTFSAITVKVSRIETDKELAARIKRIENARKANETKKQKRDELELKRKISEYKKLHSELSTKVTDFEKIIKD